MFTGIVEECGRVLERDGSRLTVEADATLGGIEIGSSMAVNGVCLTAVGIGSGHLVLGHVDGVGSVIALDRAGETARLRIEWRGEDLAPLLIPQGSVAVDGVSLTVAALEVGAFEIMLIPHTLERTTLGALKPGRRVNLEMDVIGKYVLRVLSVRGEPR